MKYLLDTIRLMNWWIILSLCIAGFTYRYGDFTFKSQIVTGSAAFLYQWQAARRKLAGRAEITSSRNEFYHDRAV